MLQEAPVARVGRIATGSGDRAPGLDRPGPKPIGIPAVGCVLPFRRPPPSRAYGAGEVWPPSLARASDEVRRLLSRDEGFADGRLPFVRRNGFWALSWWCAYALLEWPSQSRIVGAVRGLIEMASVAKSEGGAVAGSVNYRALALYNAGVLASALPGLTFQALFAEHLESASGDLQGEAAEVLSKLGGALLEAAFVTDRERLRWKGKRLVASTPRGLARAASLPFPIEGLWRGVVAVLHENGFDAPETCPYEPVRLEGVEGRHIRAVPARPGLLR